ncbi:acyl-CoA-binding protein [Deinococcus aerophilus]|nr:acyl-CoA-binding protein [Deinococcus aerophilus]
MTAFETAQADAQTLPSKPDNATLLKLYALYKQGTQGDVTGTRPGGFDFVGRAKYDAWADLQGKPSSEAQEEYVALVGSLKARG